MKPKKISLAGIDFLNPTWPEDWWDGVHHGPRDPNGPIGPHVPEDISNGI